MAYSRSSTVKIRSAILLALAGASLTVPAIAQESSEGQANAGLSEVTVTGTRLRTQTGMETPTPVTAVAPQEMAALAPGNLVDSMSQLPQFLNNSSPANVGSVTGPLGSSFLNLRGLGANRTLVLLDGRRVASSNRLGTTDIAMFPESMLKGTEVVTGGASAAYGSDAVSGVVNFLLDTDFTGVKAKLQGGMTDRSDNDNVEASLAGGMNLGERGHIMGSIEYFKANRVESYKDRDWYQNWGTVDVGGPTQPSVIARNVSSRLYTAGGLIVLPGSQLNMTQFLTGGTAAPFQNGTLVGTTRQVGGTTFYDDVVSKEQDQTGQGSLFPDTERGSVFLHADYDFNDDWNGYFQYLYGENLVNYTSTGAHMETAAWRGTLYNDNAYLPDSVRQIMLAEGRGGPTTGVPFFRYASKLDLARARGEQDNDLNSMTAGVKGNVGDVRINAYYQYGRSKSLYTAIDFPRLDRLYRSLDAVRNGAGQIVCRSTLTNPNDGCVPGNFFGAGTMSQEAIDYILEGDMWRKSTLQQHFAEVSADTLFFKDRSAGPLSIAAGFSYRDDSFRQVSGPDDLVALNVPTAASQGYRGLPTSFVGNTLLQFSGVADDPLAGRFDVKEVFTEAQLPLVNDLPGVKSLDVNGAVRYADYSGSGGVVAWKAGVDWRIIDSLRFRATRSRDTRAATLAERFDASGGGATGSDPLKGGITYSFSQLVGGNPEVKPELGDTWTFGTVWQPEFLQGFAFSVDYYDVKIKDAIAQLTIQRIIDDCFNGATALCARVIRDPVTNDITQVQNLYLNVAQARVTGVDTEMSYRRPVDWFGGGERITARLFASYLKENSSSNVGAPQRDEAGTTNLPKWTATGILGYDAGPFNATLTGRWLDKRVQFNETTITQANRLNDYGISSVFYLNAQVGYHFELPAVEDLNLYLNVQNVLDKDPPVVATWSDFFGASTTTPALHDSLGRRYSLGVEMRF